MHGAVVEPVDDRKDLLLRNALLDYPRLHILGNHRDCVASTVRNLLNRPKKRRERPASHHAGADRAPRPHILNAVKDRLFCEKFQKDDRKHDRRAGLHEDRVKILPILPDPARLKMIGHLLDVAAQERMLPDDPPVDRDDLEPFLALQIVRNLVFGTLSPALDQRHEKTVLQQILDQRGDQVIGRSGRIKALVTNKEKVPGHIYSEGAMRPFLSINDKPRHNPRIEIPLYRKNAPPSRYPPAYRP